MSVIQSVVGPQVSSPKSKLFGWVTYNTPTVVLGTLPANFFVDSANLHVVVAGNAGTTNTVSIGTDSDNALFATATAVGTTGRKSPTLGTGTGVNTTGATVKAFYAQSGTAATQGKFYVELYAYKIPSTPA